jgi:hypothetical protein
MDEIAANFRPSFPRRKFAATAKTVQKQQAVAIETH